MIQHIAPRQALELIQQGLVDVVDVREIHEWSGGHIHGSRLVPLGQLRSSPSASLPKDGILFICAAGVRSETAARLAVGLGYKTIYNLRGGTKAWADAKLPLETDDPIAAAI